MNKKISIIGGDLRIVKLIELLKKENFTISTLGLEKSNDVIEEYKIDTLKSCIKESKIILSSMPLTKDGEYINSPFSNQNIKIIDLLDKIKLYCKDSTFVAGAIPERIVDYAKSINVKIIDLLNDETLTIMNAIPSAEGAIQIAMELSDKTIHGANILVMGFGRIGKILTKMLHGIGANVYCEARKEQDLAWIQAYGYNSIDLKYLDEYLGKFDFIFNTIPFCILKRPQLQQIKKDCLIIDLASKPGGLDFETAQEIGIKVNWALGLPRKGCPTNSCTIYKRINNKNLIMNRRMKK